MCKAAGLVRKLLIDPPAPILTFIEILLTRRPAGVYHRRVAHPLVPAISFALAASVLLFFLHLYLSRREATEALRIWTLAWLLYSCRFVIALTTVFAGEQQLLLWLHQSTSVASAVLLLWGAWLHLARRRRMPILWLSLGAGVLVWITVGTVFGLQPATISWPVFVFLAAGNFAIATVYLRSRAFAREARIFLFVVFVLWGLHKLDYPVLRYLPAAAVWGYTLGAFFTTAAGMGLLALYMDQARRRAHEEREKFQGLVGSMSDVIFTLDRQGRHSGVHGRWVEECGKRPEDFIGRTAVDLFGPEAGAVHLEMARKAFVEDRPVTYEWSAGDGEERRYFQTTLSPIQAYHGPSEELVGIGRDITELKRSQLFLEQSLAEKSALLREIHHRVKNNMQMVVSILRLRSDYHEDASTQQAFREVISRIMAMAMVHEQLYQSEELTSIPFDDYLETLVPRVLESASPDSTQRPETRIAGDPVRVDIARAVPLGLITVELVSNALEHAFHSVSIPRLQVQFLADAETLTLRVCDNGPGLSVEPSAENSGTLGFSLIRSLCEQLEADLDIRANGGTDVRVLLGR